MRFLPLETCKKLVEMGCKSESEFYWSTSVDTGFSQVVFTIPPFYFYGGPPKDCPNYKYFPAFCLEDFCGSTLGEKNLETLEKNGIVIFATGLGESRDWVKYIEELVG